MFEKLQTKKMKISYLLLVSLIAFSAYFMVSLTFQYLGNKISNPNLIIGFTFGLIAPIILGVTSYLLFWKKFAFHYQIIFLTLAIIGIALAITSLVCGTIGYLEVT